MCLLQKSDKPQNLMDSLHGFIFVSRLCFSQFFSECLKNWPFRGKEIYNTLYMQAQLIVPQRLTDIILFCLASFA